jgi:uncharacterized protein (UPF0335 family)
MKNFQPVARQLPFVRHARVFAMCGAVILMFSAFVLLPPENGAGRLTGLTGAQAADNVFSGAWTAELSRSQPDKIQFTFHNNSSQGNFSISGSTIAFAELRGLTREAATSAKSEVNFNIVREAGTFACEGFFKEGKGAGFWTLTPNPAFIAAMRGRGYDNLKDEDLRRAAFNDLKVKYIDDLKQAGYDRLDFNQLSRAASHTITPQFISELRGTGFENLTMEQLIRARNHEINAEYIKEVRTMGFDKQPLETLIRLRNHEITREFIDRMRTAGFENLSPEQLIRLKNHDITPEFVNEIKAEGFSEISVETAIRLKSRGVDRDFIRRAKGRGLTNLTLEQLIRLRSNDIVK